MKAFLHKMWQRDERHPVVSTVITGVIVVAVIEMLNQRSITGGLMFMFENPLMFIVNAMIVLTTLCITLFFKKRRIWAALISFLWIILSIVNFCVRTYRTTPLRALDFRVAKSVMNIVSMYFQTWMIVLGTAAIAVILAGLVFAWIKAKKIRPKYRVCIVTFIVCIALSFLSIETAINTETVPTHFNNLTNAYVDYGFVYCFSASLLGNGITKPDTYSQNNVNLIKEKNTSYEESSKKRPNIIYVQLESFFDVSNLKDFTYSEDPTPCFNKLKSKYPGGTLTVASFGTGTANTEFDVLTGMNVQFFGAGEYPYATILRETTCESINYSLKELGYATHAIHNHRGNFYARNKVYPNLGFDTFTSVEYMQNVEYNVLGWAKDRVLTREIVNTLESTEGSDFVFTVSVQPHGRYSTEVIDDTQTITIEGAADEGEKNAYEYYINQLHQTDEFVGELVEALKDFREPTVVVFYGDHLPNIGMDDSDLVEGATIYDSEYVIWNNAGYDFESRDLATYQLSAFITKSLGFENWELANLHEAYEYDLENREYMRDLKMIQYDVLYGEKYYYYTEEEIPAATEMKMGIYDIVIEDVLQVGDDIHVIGENFTESSAVSLDGDKRDTIFISPNELVVEDVTMEVGETARVYQMASSRSWLSRTELYYYGLGPAWLVKIADMNEADAIENSRGNSIADHDNDE